MLMIELERRNSVYQAGRHERGISLDVFPCTDKVKMNAKTVDPYGAPQVECVHDRCTCLLPRMAEDYIGS